MARSTGAAPRQRGNSEKWTLTMGTSASTSGFDEPPVGDDNPQLGPEGHDVGRLVHNGQPELDRRHLDRARAGRRSAAAAGVGPGHHDQDVVARLDQRPQRPGRHLGSAEEGQFHLCAAAPVPLRAAGSSLGPPTEFAHRLFALVVVEQLQEEPPVQVVDLVLVQRRLELLSLYRNLVAVEVVTRDVDLHRAG